MINNIIDKNDVLAKIANVAEQIEKEESKQKVDYNKLTTLLFEQLLDGLYLQTIPLK